MRKPWLVLTGLALAMAVAAIWLLLAGRGHAFHGDELFYFARLVTDGGVATDAPLGIEYVLAPHNDHLVVGGRLVYELLFAIAGSDYLAFRIALVGGLLACVGLFFVLARRRVDPLIALALGVLLLFLGFASETLMWPFNVHTVYALALGLGAILALERDERIGDLVACGLLVASVAMVEVGLCFAVGAAIHVLQRPDRGRRAWIILVPSLLYAAWWLWARKFGQSDAELANVGLIPRELIEALAAVLGSLTGINPTGSGQPSEVVGVGAGSLALAGLALAGLAVRIRSGGVPPTLWVFLAVVIAYWVQLAMGGRSPDSTRYIYVGSVLVLLVFIDALRGIRLPWPVVPAVFVLVALAIPSNIAKLDDRRAVELAISRVTRSEYAMIELAREQVHPDYVPALDEAVQDAGGALFVPLSAGQYLEGAERNGYFGASLGELREEQLRLRQIADATLVGALDLDLAPVTGSAGWRACPVVADGAPGDLAFFRLDRGGVLLGSRGDRPIQVGLSRFAAAATEVPLGALPAGGWAQLRIPPDSAPDPWYALVDGPVYVCPPSVRDG